MELIKINEFALSEIARLLKLQFSATSLSDLHDDLCNLASETWISPDNAPGGNSAAFYEVVGSDGLPRIMAWGPVDISSLDLEDQPWFSLDRLDCTDEELEEALSEREFVAIFEGDEADDLREELDRARGEFDVYNAMAYAIDLLNVFEDAIGVVRRDHYSY